MVNIIYVLKFKYSKIATEMVHMFEATSLPTLNTDANIHTYNFGGGASNKLLQHL